MSLQWPETLMNISARTLYGSELRVLVQPNSIELSLFKRDLAHVFKPQVMRRMQIESAQASATQGLSSDLLQKLSKALESQQWRGVTAVAVLSNSFARYAVLPWNDAINGKSERKAYLQHTFTQHFGEHSKAWHLNVHEAGYGNAVIASGVERSLLEQLQGTFASAQMPLKVIHPLLMLATNQALKHLKKSRLPQSFWLCCAENQRLTLALVKNGDWKRVWNVAAEADVGAQIQTLIQREAVLDAASAQLPVLQYGTQALAAAQVRLTQLPPEHATGAEMRRMAV